jgi:periplasmic protein TonB
MNWVRFGSAGTALGVHIAALGLFVFSAAHEPDLSALQSGSGDDDLTIVATVTMQSEESLGLDAASVQRQEASLGGQAAPQVQEEVKKEEEKVELPPEESPEPVPLVEEKKPEKKIVEPKPSTPAPASEAQEEQRAATRAFEARRNEVLSLYNSRVYQALMKNALRPKTMEKGRVVLELTLAPSGELLGHHVVQSSGSETLDRTAMTSLERAAPFPPAPPEVSKEPHTLRVPFEYAVK